MNYSAALRYLVENGGRATRAYWASEAYRSGTDRRPEQTEHIVVITVRELGLDSGQVLMGEPIVEIYNVVSGMKTSWGSAVARRWKPSQTDILATDWEIL